MRTLQLKEIGALLIEIDIEHTLLVRLLTREGLRSAEVYRKECQRIERVRKHVLRELAELIRQRHWRSPMI